MTNKVMKLLDENTGLMECKKCKSQHHANIKDGKFQRGTWQCQNKCK